MQAPSGSFHLLRNSLLLALNLLTKKLYSNNHKNQQRKDAQQPPETQETKETQEVKEKKETKEAQPQQTQNDQQNGKQQSHKPKSSLPLAHLDPSAASTDLTLFAPPLAMPSLTDLLSFFTLSLRKDFETGAADSVVKGHLDLLLSVSRNLMGFPDREAAIAPACATLRELMHDYVIKSPIIVRRFLAFLLAFDKDEVPTCVAIFSAALHTNFRREMDRVSTLS